MKQEEIYRWGNGEREQVENKLKTEGAKEDCDTNGMIFSEEKVDKGIHFNIYKH